MNTGNRKSTRAALIAGTASFVLVQILFAVFSGIFQTWNSQIQDRLFSLRSSTYFFKPAYDGAVVHVDINNSAIDRLNTSYLTREHYARVIRNLGAMGVAVQAQDMIFAEETGGAGDSALVQAAKEAKNAYFGMAFALEGGGRYGERERAGADSKQYLEKTGWKLEVKGGRPGMWEGKTPLITFPALAFSARGLGFLSIRTDPDGVVRRAPLLVSYNGAFYPSLPFRAACDYLGVGPENIVVEPGRAITLKGAARHGQKPHNISIPIDRDGNMVVNFIGPWETMRHYSFADVYRASDDREELRMWRDELDGRIVLVSDVSTGATDLGPVPGDVNYPLSGMHASVIHTILTERFLKELSYPRMFAIELLALCAVLLLSVRFSPLAFTVGSAALAVLYASAAALLFMTGGLLLQIVRPLACIGAASAAILLYRYLQDEKEKEVLRRTFESYFPPEVVKKLVDNPAMLDRGSKKELTVLFSDIKDFTAWSSTVSPDQVRRLLNEYFEAMVEIVFTNGGTVDKYMGDGLMVFFGDPEPLPDHALRAIRTAVAMQKRSAELRAKWLKEHRFPLTVRIGLHSGEVIVGNMGSSRRLSYTVLGPAVNLAKRLESEAPPGGILLSENTCRLAGGWPGAEPLGSMHFKGISEPVGVYRIVVDGGAAQEGREPGVKDKG